MSGGDLLAFDDGSQVSAKAGAAVGCPLLVIALVEHPTVRLLFAEIGALTGGRPR